MSAAGVHPPQRTGRAPLGPDPAALTAAAEGAPDRGERLTVSELADCLALSLNTVTELCGRAGEAGLVRREESTSDLRLVYFRLTEEGERRLHGALLETERYRDELVRSFSGLSESFRVATRR